MKSAVHATVASGVPVIVGEPVAAPHHKIALAAKMAGAAFFAVLVPVY
jgi:hypothetical protein